MTFSLYIAPALMCTGLFIVFQAWRSKGESKSQSLLAWLGGLTILLSFTIFIYAQGSEFGIVLAAAYLSIIAWLIIVLNIQIQSTTKRNSITNQRKSSNPKDKSNRSRNIGVFFVAGPLSLVASGTFSMASALLLPLERVNEMAIAALSFPFYLGLSCYLVCMYQKPIRDGLVLLSITLISVAWIFS